MPILTELPELDLVADGRVIELEGLPRFNDPDDWDELFKVTQFDGWFDTAAVESQLVPNGGGAGAVAVGDWLPSEALYVLGGIIDTGRESLADMRRLLLAALPFDREATVTVLGNGYDVDLCIYVRRYDRASIRIGSVLEFTVPLVAPDPFKYALQELSGVVGVFTGELWYRQHTGTDANPTTFYNPQGGRWVRFYQREAGASAYPDSMQLQHRGDARSSRVRADVAGPLEAGDWWLLNESTGRRLWAELNISSGQLLTLDMHTKTATLNGTDVGHLVYGDWLTLEPGVNTFRLVSGNPSSAYATITAREAYL